MSDFFKRNLVWISILLCVTGIVLSIVGIPTGNPIFFFVGIVLSLPTIGYLIYYVFFYQEKPELNLTPTTSKVSTSNITSIVTDKKSVLLSDEITDEDDLEPFYNGYASEEEIAKRLHEVTNDERERAVIKLPEIELPEVNTGTPYENMMAIENATNHELLRQREAATNTAETFSAEVPADLMQENFENKIEAEPVTTQIETPMQNEVELENEVEETTNTQSEMPRNYTIDIDDFNTFENEELETNEPVLETELDTTENATQDNELSLDDPNYTIPDEPIMPQNNTANEMTTAPQSLTSVDLTNAKIVHVDPALAELRKQKLQEKKTLLAQDNLERYLRRYFVETAACFLMDRVIYKDKNGIAPYNKFAVNKDTNLPEYTMSSTKGKLYKFCTYLVDAERFITHPYLYNDFVTAIEQGASLSRISETLHPLYRKKYKKDFVLNLSHREDWDNVIILVYNHYLLNNDNFKDIFTHVPFEIPFAYNDENIIDYLKDTDLQDRFAEKYSALEEMGVPTFWEALYICFINSVKQKLTIEQMENAIMREYKKIARSLKRIDATRRKIRKAS